MKFFFALFLLLFYASSMRAMGGTEDLVEPTENLEFLETLDPIGSLAPVESLGSFDVPSSLAPRDTLARRGKCATSFRARQLIFPAVAIALGGAGVRSHLVNTSGDRGVRTRVDDAFQYVPIGAYAALGFIPGVRHNHNIGERVLAGATAYVVMTGLCQGVKYIVREPRPDGSNDRSFPSGHTAKAFCGAELCRLEYGNIYGAAAYAFAAATGVMRVVNNRHWCNDVLAGAGIGFLSAHVGYWLLPYEKRLVGRLFPRTRKWASECCFVPGYEYEVKAPTFALSMIF